MMVPGASSVRSRTLVRQNSRAGLRCEAAMVVTSLCPMVAAGRSILVAHADAAGGDRITDRPGRIGAVDAVKRGAKIHGASAERVGGAALHAGGEVVPLGGFAGDHFGRRAPGRPFRLACNLVFPRPL